MVQIALYVHVKNAGRHWNTWNKYLKMGEKMRNVDEHVAIHVNSLLKW